MFDFLDTACVAQTKTHTFAVTVVALTVLSGSPTRQLSDTLGDWYLTGQEVTSEHISNIKENTGSVAKNNSKISYSICRFLHMGKKKKRFQVFLYIFAQRILRLTNMDYNLTI